LFQNPLPTLSTKSFEITTLLSVGNISAYVRGIANNSAYAGGVEIILHMLEGRGSYNYFSLLNSLRILALPLKD